METINWEGIAALVIALGTAFATIRAAIRGAANSPASSASEEQAKTVAVAGSFTDGRRLDDLTKAIDAAKEVMRDAAEERHRDDRAMQDAIETLSRRLQENTDAQRAGGQTPEWMVRLLTKIDK